MLSTYYSYICGCDTKMTKKFISILSLYFYVKRKNFENDIHLIFFNYGYAEMLLNEIDSISKASHIQSQYMIQDKVRLVQPNYGKTSMEAASISEREAAIEEKVENIISLDIALLKFISSVPEIIEKNSFKLPKNADMPYLVNEYKIIKEQRIMQIISKSLDLYSSAEFVDSYRAIGKLESVEFNNQMYTSRFDQNIMEHGSENNIHNHILMINFFNMFFENSKYRTVSEINSQTFPRSLLNFSVDLRQTLYAMSSMFSVTEKTHTFITNFFNKSGANNALDQNENLKAKRPTLSVMTRREASTYANRFMVLVVYFMFIEENNDLNSNNDKLPPFIEEYRNQFILVMNRILEHLIEYIQFKVYSSRIDGNINEQTIFSQLPLIDIDNLDPNKRPITNIVYAIQYALNFAPFLCNASL